LCGLTKDTLKEATHDGSKNKETSLRPSPAIKVIIAIEKVQLFTLTTVYLIFSPPDLLFNSLLAFKYYFSFFFYYFVANTQ
jgi:hypothetical protein